MTGDTVAGRRVSDQQVFAIFAQLDLKISKRDGVRLYGAIDRPDKSSRVPELSTRTMESTQRPDPVRETCRFARQGRATSADSFVIPNHSSAKHVVLQLVFFSERSSNG